MVGRGQGRTEQLMSWQTGSREREDACAEGFLLFLLLLNVWPTFKTVFPP
jgi:hypothetical protein